jgi:SMP-30/Gluconolactonase/LRE-like region
MQPVLNSSFFFGVDYPRRNLSQGGALHRAFAITSSSVVLITFLLAVLVTVPSRLVAQDQDDVRGAPAEPLNAPEIRAQIAFAENLLGKTPDRGAILYFLAVSHALLRDTLPAIDQLKQCVALKEGFDPSGDNAFAVIKTSSDFRRLVEQVHKDFPAINESRVAFTTTDKDIIPEGLEYDPANDSFYLSSLYHQKILRIPRDGKVEDFAPNPKEHLLPVLGIRMDPSNGTIWSVSSDEEAGKSELLHFDRAGTLLDRYPSLENSKHEFNDLVVLRNGTIFLTDSIADKVYRFDVQADNFTPIHTSRELLFPNGIALAGDEDVLYVADQLGVLRIDLKEGTSAEVDPGPHSTVAGIDGLYWHKGSLIAVQNGIGTPRIAAFRLSADGVHVVKTTVLANFLTTPTTGALRGDDFYFIVNSQVDNLNGPHILDVTKLQPVRIAVVHLP